MLFEPKIGKLFRKLNPYTNGGMRTMLAGADPPADPAALNLLGQDLLALGNALIAYAGAANPANLKSVNDAEDKINTDLGLADIDLSVDNDFRQDYMTWTFRNQPQGVKRALRIPYRYQLTDRQGVLTGIFVTDHVLVGYCGANG